MPRATVSSDKAWKPTIGQKTVGQTTVGQTTVAQAAVFRAIGPNPIERHAIARDAIKPRRPIERFGPVVLARVTRSNAARAGWWRAQANRPASCLSIFLRYSSMAWSSIQGKSDSV